MISAADFADVFGRPDPSKRAIEVVAALTSLPVTANNENGPIERTSDDRREPRAA